MRKLLKLAAVILSVIAATQPALAGDKADRNEKRAELATKQAQYIAGEIALDDATTKKFVDAYVRCQNEVMALGKAPSYKDNTVSEQEAEKEIKANFDHSQKLLDIHKKYYAEYSKFLNQRQIRRVYRLEKKMRKDFRARHKRQRPHNH